MKKRIMSALLSLVLIASIMPAAAYAMSFPDVPADSDYAEAIAYISETGIMVGDTQGNFNPEQIVSRAEMAALVCRMLGMAEDLPASEIFSDVSTDHWANAYVAKAAELGIVGGYGNGKFGPDDPVTYEQSVTMIVRAIGEDDRANSNGGYPDGYLLVAQEKNLLNGIQAVQGQGLSRGAVAMLLYNYYTTQNNPGTPSEAGEHTHNYIEQAVPGSGHYEQVQTGTIEVTDYRKGYLYGCGACDFTTTSRDEISDHTNLFKGPCGGSNYWMKEQEVPNGTHEEPVYENQWVEDTIRVCSICGQQE